MNVFICLDDTDNLKSAGTGKLAAQLAAQMEDRGWGKCSFISRHQLLVHPAIPYTSHNSAMCFTAELKEGVVDEVVGFAASFLERESAPGSDPGLCLAVAEKLAKPQDLLAFGQAAKRRVLDKEAAFALARELGVHLSEHGGSGQGVVGALAGVGLRLGGNDGRIKGRLEIAAPGAVVSAELLFSHPEVEEVRALTGEPVQKGDLVRIGEKIKMVLRDGKAVLLLIPSADPREARWHTIPRSALNDY
ncbi:MAG: hypothetical protein GXY54_11000 [Deltaproteobacteria bacterium]|nr:hypothetical protein [Deltaproteobacteria bacterium]